MEYISACTDCRKETKNPLDYKCSCGQPLETCIDLRFESRKIKKRTYTLWRYAEFIPYTKDMEITTLGEGWTPFVRFSNNIYFKLENLNPTGSFKDRGSTVLISALRRLVEGTGSCISEDSSGNAGASIAAYAARAGLRAKIYVPDKISGPKFDQIRFYGAEVVKVSGGRERVAQEAQKNGRRKFYVGHILHPLFRDGIRSLSYEIAEQFDWDIPEYIYMPVSAGTLLLGVIGGFRHLVESGMIDAPPKIVACQTRQVSPLYHQYRNTSYTPSENFTSIADALVSVDPPLLNIMIRRLREINGEAVVVEEDETFNAFKELSGKGFFVEPSSAVPYAAYKKKLKNRELSKDDDVLIILTGTGLKTKLKPC